MHECVGIWIWDTLIKVMMVTSIHDITFTCACIVPAGGSVIPACRWRLFRLIWNMKRGNKRDQIQIHTDLNSYVVCLGGVHRVIWWSSLCVHDDDGEEEEQDERCEEDNQENTTFLLPPLQSPFCSGIIFDPRRSLLLTLNIRPPLHYYSSSLMHFVTLEGRWSIWKLTHL